MFPCTSQNLLSHPVFVTVTFYGSKLYDNILFGVTAIIVLFNKYHAVFIYVSYVNEANKKFNKVG